MIRAFGCSVFLTMSALSTMLQGQAPTRVLSHPPERPDSAGRYLFYLHGRIVEDQGASAMSPEYGPYEYSAIVRELADSGFTVISEVRAANTDAEVYADSAAAQIRRLLDGGVQARNITVIGASKGAVIAMLVSSRLRATIRYVLMANCNEYIFRMFSLQLHGDVLSIHEASDPLGQTCGALFEQSPALGERREIRLETGLGHGFIFRPLEAWVRPALAWARRGADPTAPMKPMPIPSAEDQDVSITVGYSRLLGGSAVDDCDAVAVDHEGTVYLGCHSDSPDLPGPEGAEYAIKGHLDAFVLKLSPDGRRTAYRTQIGGAGWEAVTGIAVDGVGSVYAVGATYSADLPTAAGAAQPRHAGGGDDAFVARLDPAGTIVYLTYLGGSGRDDAMGVTVDRAGNAYVVGRTASPDFPTSRDALERLYRGGTDAFLTKLDPSGRIVYSTYLGGTGGDAAMAVGLDAAGNIHVAGQTQSTDFPLVQSLQPTHRSESDSFIVIVDPTGRRLLSSSLWGGSGWDAVNALTLDAAGHIYLTGSTRSLDFPVSAQTLQAASGGREDAFVVKLRALATGVVYSTYLGGSGNESGAGVVTTSAGGVFVVGGTESPDFPTVRPLQARLRGTLSGYVALLDSMGSRILFSTYYGGGDRDLFEDAAPHPGGGLVVTGLTASVDFPMVGGLTGAFAGGWRDILVVKFDVGAR